jgi:nicotinamide mononucleotide transporter
LLAALLALGANRVALLPLEVAAVAVSALSVWLLARNNPLGWWLALLGVTLYAVVFYRTRLFAEVGIQIVYFVTSLKAISIWLRGGEKQTAKPVSRASGRLMALTLALSVAGVVALRWMLIELRGAAPFWDALTTVISLSAHLYLMERYVESWHQWVAVDFIYVPLYASRELYLTSGLYAVFLVMATYGLLNFRRLWEEQQSLHGKNGGHDKDGGEIFFREEAG